MRPLPRRPCSPGSAGCDDEAHETQGAWSAHGSASLGTPRQERACKKMADASADAGNANGGDGPDGALGRLAMAHPHPRRWAPITACARKRECVTYCQRLWRRCPLPCPGVGRVSQPRDCFTLAHGANLHASSLRETRAVRRGGSGSPSGPPIREFPAVSPLSPPGVSDSPGTDRGQAPSCTPRQLWRRLGRARYYGPPSRPPPQPRKGRVFPRFSSLASALAASTRIPLSLSPAPRPEDPRPPSCPARFPPSKRAATATGPSTPDPGSKGKPAAGEGVAVAFQRTHTHSHVSTISRAAPVPPPAVWAGDAGRVARGAARWHLR